MTVKIELDDYEARALHFSAAFSQRLLGEAAPEELEQVPMPDGRKVYPLDSALMKLEVAMHSEGVEI